MSATLSLGKGEIDALLTKVPTLLNTLRDSGTTLVNNASSVLDKLPAPVAANVRQLLKRFVELHKKLFRELSRPVTEPGDPWALWAAGTDWTKQVGTALNDQAALLGQPNAALDDNWDGPASTRYGRVLDQQKGLMEAIKDITTPLQDTLTTAANSIILMWVGIAGAVAAVLPNIVGTAIAAAGVVTIPAAIALAVETILQLLIFAVAILAAVATALTEAKSNLATLQQLQAVGGFTRDPKDAGKRHWPGLSEPLDRGKEW